MLKGRGQAFVLVDANGNEIVGERRAGHRLDGKSMSQVDKDLLTLR